MWPKLLDMSREECKHLLRKLELEAYASVISAFRAQGDLTPEKKQMLMDMATTLSISTERHKAEIRRAVNDEKLTTVAERLGGSNSSIEWSIEGRRLVPLMPRFVPQTVFTVTANQAANMAYAHNMTLPEPEGTAKREGSQSQGGLSKQMTPANSSNNNIVLPPGTVLPMKNALDLHSLEEQAKVRETASTSSSYTSNPASYLSALTGGKAAAAAASGGSGSKLATSHAATQGKSSTSATPSSMKITFTKVPSGTTPTTSPSGQKVIIMSSANNGDHNAPNILHRSQSLPSSTRVTMATMAEGHCGPDSHSVGTEEPMTGISTSHVTGIQPGAGTTVKQQRTKGVAKQKMVKPVSIMQPTGGPGISTTASGAFGAGVTASGAIVPTVMGAGGKRAPIPPQKQEPGMKLITQTVATSSGKMVSKTFQLAPTTGTPGIRTTTIGMAGSKSTAAPGSASPVMGPRNIVNTGGPRLVNLPSQMTGPSRSTTSNVITLSPMALQKSGGKTTPSTVVVTKPGAVVQSKTNVIVVQKSQIKSKTIGSPRASSAGMLTHTTSILTRPKIAMAMTGASGGSIPVSLGAMSQAIRFPSPANSGQKGIRGPSPVSMVTSSTVGATGRQGRSPSPMGVGLMGLKTAGQELAGTKTHVGMRPKSPIAQTMATLPAPRSPLSSELDPQGKFKGHRRSSSISPTGRGSPRTTLDVPGNIMRSASSDPSKPVTREPSLIFQPGSKPNTEWIEYDGTPPSGQSASSAIKALLEFRGQPQVSTTAGSMVKQSTVTKRIPPVLSLALSTDQRKVTTQCPTMVTVETRGGVAERLEFSADQLSTVVDQFEQFLESEGLDESRTAVSSLSSDSQARLRGSGEVSGSQGTINPGAKEKVSSSSVLSVVPKEARHSKSVSSQREEPTKIDPFEFVDDFVVKKPQGVVSSPNSGEEIPRLSTTRVTSVTTSDKHEVLTAPIVASRSQPSVGAASVVMESSRFDISQMNLEDLSCRRMREEEDDDDEDDDGGDDEEKKGRRELRDDDAGSMNEMLSFPETSSGGSGSEGAVGSPLSDCMVRISRRKRKAPTPIDEETGPSSMPSWARAAWNLLQRVMRFRGANRPKGGINAASWFTRPVDPSEAPGYHKIVKRPMDFGTIKRKLEAGTYQDFADFHQDMMLVRGNCLQYNPPGHAARKDCDEVFQFYTSEYSKTLERWQKQLLLAPKSPKRIRTEPQ